MDKLTVIENSLIPVYQSDKGTNLVNMRELHSWLNIGRDFPTWIKDRIEKYGFIENQDYILFPNSGENSEGRPRIDYIFKLDPAKEIAMVENNEKGKEIRRYFIKIEEKFKQTALDFSKLSPELQAVHNILFATAKLETQVKQLTDTQQAIKAAVISETDNWREDIRHKLNKIAQSIGSNKFQDVRSESYKLLEQRAGVLLERRLDNLKVRLMKEGIAKSRIDKTGKIDVIDQDKKLREIYAKIVSEYLIRYVA
jgi:phage anti-repressor protein